MAVGTNKRCEGEHELVTKVDGTETAQLNEGAAVSSLASEEGHNVWIPGLVFIVAIGTFVVPKKLSSSIDAA